MNYLIKYVYTNFVWFWYGLMVFNAIFNNFQLYRGGQFYFWRKLAYPEKTTDLSSVTNNFEVLYKSFLYIRGDLGVSNVVLNATFNNILVISWRSLYSYNIIGLIYIQQ